jgi:ubiquitin C-terminal hydrolase
MKKKNKNDYSISIYDCLNQFNKEEKLERENTWYCDFCKKQQEALKKITETQDRCVHIQKNRKRHENDNQKQIERQEHLDEQEELNRKMINERKNINQRNK